jgi:hypothetical protein
MLIVYGTQARMNSIAGLGGALQAPQVSVPMPAQHGFDFLAGRGRGSISMPSHASRNQLQVRGGA